MKHYVGLEQSGWIHDHAAAARMIAYERDCSLVLNTLQNRILEQRMLISRGASIHAMLGAEEVEAIERQQWQDRQHEVEAFDRSIVAQLQDSVIAALDMHLHGVHQRSRRVCCVLESLYM